MADFIIRTVIIDDEPEARDLLKNLLETIPEIKIVAMVGNASSGEKAILNMIPDLVFLDIKMPQKSGLSLVKELVDKQINTRIVFVTAYDEFAIEAIRLAAFDYLLKPIDLDDLNRVVDRLKSQTKESSLNEKINSLLKHLSHSNKIRLNTRTGFILVDPADIIYVQAEGNYSLFVFSQLRKELVTVQIGLINEILPMSKFIRVSRSGLINKDYLCKVDRKSKQCELFKNGETHFVHVSRDHISNLE